MEMEQLLRLMVEKGGSDLFITAGVPPSMKVNGRILPVSKTPLSPEMTRETVLGTMNEQQRREFAENHECNFAISARGIGPRARAREGRLGTATERRRRGDADGRVGHRRLGARALGRFRLSPPDHRKRRGVVLRARDPDRAPLEDVGEPQEAVAGQARP